MFLYYIIFLRYNFSEGIVLKSHHTVRIPIYYTLRTFVEIISSVSLE